MRRGEVVAKIGGGKMLAKLYIAEEDIREIDLNQSVMISLNTDEEQYYEGVVSKIYPSFDEIEQSFIVEASFKSQPPSLYHNTQLQANIIIDERQDAMVIPTQFLAGEDSVMTKKGGLQFVKVGIRSDQWVEILDGINNDDILQKPKRL